MLSHSQTRLHVGECWQRRKENTIKYGLFHKALTAATQERPDLIRLHLNALI